MHAEIITKIQIDNNNGGVNPFNDNYPSALMALLMAGINTQQEELELQGAVSNVETDWSTGAYNAVEAGDTILSNDAAAVKKAAAETGSDSQRNADITTANAQYQVDQTTINNGNQNYSTIVQGGNTSITSLSQVEAQNLQSTDAVPQAMSAQTNMISGWQQ